jgi:hypothetical protein
MLRRIAMAALFVGAVSGYAHGFRSMRHHHMQQRRAAVEQFSHSCAEAAVQAHQRQIAAQHAPLSAQPR